MPGTAELEPVVERGIPLTTYLFGEARVGPNRVWTVPVGFGDTARDVAPSSRATLQDGASVGSFRVAPVFAGGIPSGTFSVLVDRVSPSYERKLRAVIGCSLAKEPPACSGCLSSSRPLHSPEVVFHFRVFFSPRVVFSGALLFNALHLIMSLHHSPIST